MSGRDKDGPNKVYVVAWAIDVPILQGVEKGDFGMTVAQNPYMMGVQSMLELWSAAHPTQFDSMTNPGFGQVPTSDLDTGVKILVKGDPGDQGLDDAAEAVSASGEPGSSPIGEEPVFRGLLRKRPRRAIDN